MSIPAGVGILVDIIIAFILIFSFLGGLKEGAAKEFFALLALIIALALSGVFYGYVSSWLAFFSDATWRYFVGFLLTVGIIMIILYLVFMIPRNLLEKVWNGGIIWNVLGGVFALLNSAIGLTVLVALLEAFPVLEWLSDVFLASNILNWLVSKLSYITLLIPGTVN